MSNELSKQEIANRSAKANQIFAVCMDKLSNIKKRQRDAIGNLVKKTDSRKIDNLKKEIEGL